jgi:hypothetical protein
MAQTQHDKQAKDLAAGVSTEEQDAKLKHSDEDAPQTTRSDRLDLGVPMLPGDPKEPSGPEDALGPGPKRGDYRARQPEGSVHVETVLAEDGGEPIMETVKDADGNDVEIVVDYKPMFVPVVQNPRVNDIGDAPKLKGGVETDEDSKTA